MVEIRCNVQNGKSKKYCGQEQHSQQEGIKGGKDGPTQFK